uniref:Innexin n=1 Tax=Wuchereria bancrofti TaxID=6293 RepID=A0AAF5Q545_WUCBA
MDKLSIVIESLTKPRYEEDSVDRLNYHVTTLILLIAAFTIIAKEYGGDPIQCWLPAELASQKSWEQYAEDYCFVENTYYIPLEQNMPQSEKHRDERLITYYQWVPFTLILQAMLFVIPHIFWRMLNWTSNVQTRAVISMADSVRQMGPCSDEARDIVDAIASHIYHAEKSTKHLHKILQNSNLLVIFTRIFTQSYLSTVYLITKLLFVVNATVQFWIVSLYLGGNGYDLTRALLRQQTWQSTGLFPRVTMCDFKIRVMGNVHRHTIQCVLMANMFNEKIYVALWWWLLAVITLTVVNFFYWIYTLNSVTSSHQFLIRLVTLGQPQKEVASHFMQLFAEQFVGDTVLVLRLVAQNASELVASSIAARLFDIFVKKRVENERKRNTCHSEGKTRRDLKITLATSTSSPEGGEGMRKQ